MYTTERTHSTITCDKCGQSDTAIMKDAGKVFFNLGYSLNMSARKYTHRCRNCHTKKEKKAHDFVAEKFKNQIN